MDIKNASEDRILVDPEWIRRAIAVNKAGGCDAHIEGAGSFSPTCGCCQLARAYLDWRQRQNHELFR